MSESADPQARQLGGLKRFLDRLDEELNRGETIAVGAFVGIAGPKAFGPILMLAGLVVALGAFGLSLVARDGLLALAALLATGCMAGWVLNMVARS